MCASCWTKDAGALDLDKMQVLLTGHHRRQRRRAPGRGGRAGRRAASPAIRVFRAFAERAVRAVLDPRCANLPLPQTMLGKINELTFRFSP